MARHYRKYTLEQGISAIKSSPSIAQALIKLGLAPKGGNYRVIHRIIKENRIDTSHFTGQLWNKGKTTGPKRPIEDYLSNRVFITSHNLRERLIREKIFSHQCSSCKLTKWMSNPIPLELDHVDGNHENNFLTNLTLLCPNCHALTNTYRGRNIGASRGNRTPNP